MRGDGRIYRPIRKAWPEDANVQEAGRILGLQASEISELRTEIIWARHDVTELIRWIKSRNPPTKEEFIEWLEGIERGLKRNESDHNTAFCDSMSRAMRDGLLARRKDLKKARL